MSSFAATAACIVLGALAVFQALLACGMPFGRFAWGGGHDVLPPRLRMGSLATIAAYALMGWVLVTCAGQGGGGVVGVAAWVITGFFLLGAAGNLASRSHPERLLMAPVALLLCALSLVVAVLA